MRCLNMPNSKLNRIQGCFLGCHPLAKQWSRLSGETLTTSNRRTIGLKEFVDGIPKGGMKCSLGHGGFGGSLEATPNGD
ncbi:hypothetical protein C8R11_10373 [Nitrosomonas aestuarii]|nr:hypothetical protein C8R11_10373 [Nitrosomonas aestuarii]